jgi:aspartyl aminopeptidase
VKAADVGVAQLAMHSPYETCGSGDTEDLAALARALFSASLEETGSDCWAVR